MWILGQVAPALQVFLYLRWLESESDDSVTNASVEADAGCEEPPPPKCPGSERANQWSRKTNGHSWRRLAATLPTGADASLYGGLSLTSPEMSLLLFPSSLTAISIVDLSHAGAESLLGVSFFNYLTSPISASLSPPSGQTLHSRRKATKC